MILSRRNLLKKLDFVKGETHPGLWYDKFLEKQIEASDKIKDDNPSPFTELIKQCCEIGEPTLYQKQFDRWQATLQRSGAHLVKFKSVVKIALGMGTANVIENGLTIHQTYGVPYLPGSSLKGLASSYAHRFLSTPWQKGKPAHETLFGSPDAAGFVSFYDALPLPTTVCFHPEIMTVHHGDYYGSGNSAPTDWDNPNPIPFLTFSGTFLVALAAPDASEWLPTCVGILKKALWETGIGAKTSSGYGRLSSISGDSVSINSKTDQTAPEDIEQSMFDQFMLRLQNLPASNYASELRKFVSEWQQTNPDYKHRHNMARGILDIIEERTSGRRQKKFKQKAWYQALLDSLPADDFRHSQY